MLNPKSYDGARVLEASGRPMLVIGRSYELSIQVEVAITKLAEEMMEYKDEDETCSHALSFDWCSGSIQYNNPSSSP